MQVHHGQAVEMAMQIYRTTEDTELRTLAYDIATGQSAQRGEMFDWLVQWGLPQAGRPADELDGGCRTVLTASMRAPRASRSTRPSCAP